jgi:hypothetical protein
MSSYLQTSRKADLEIELAGSTVDWSMDKSSRKNVFQLNTSTDLQMLLQADDTETAQVTKTSIRI